MSDIQPLLDRLRAMYVPASLQLQLQPRLTREDAEQIIAQLTAALATVEKCKQAGFIDERGEVRGVAGKLFYSADNAIIGMDAELYVAGGAKADAVGNGFAWGPVTFCIDTAERFRRAYPLDQCYSTPSAAAAAKGGGQ